MQTLIEAKNLTHIFEDSDGKKITALNKVNLKIAKGEFVAIIGANGSGKSTLARHFNGLLQPTSGECLVEGLSSSDEKNLWNIRQRVGMVFQNPDNQIVAALVEEDVAFGPENIGIESAEIKKRVDSALEAVAMTDYAQHAPHLLSGGQKQRVAIAGVLALLPECIVLDEPTAMLDPRGRSEILETVKRLNKERNMTIVYITHYMEEALQADRIIVMNDGVVELQGKPHQVFSEADKLKSFGLETPLAAQVANELRKRGVKLPTDIITNEELAKALCQ